MGDLLRDGPARGVVGPGVKVGQALGLKVPAHGDDEVALIFQFRRKAFAFAGFGSDGDDRLVEQRAAGGQRGEGAGSSSP
jgi:hypothetical protein